jgi:predicted transcriptional regulator
MIRISKKNLAKLIENFLNEEESKPESEESESNDESDEKIKNISEELDPLVAVRNYIMMLKNNKDTGIDKKIKMPKNVAAALNKIKMSNSENVDQESEFDFDTLQSKYSVRINKFFDKYGQANYM